MTFPIVVGDSGSAGIEVAGAVGRHRDGVRKPIRIVPSGFPHRRSWAGALEANGAEFTIPMPAEAQPGSTRVALRLFPSPLSSLQAGLDGILQDPHGCFEQASSANYPNTLVLAYLEASGDNVPSVAARARVLLPKGYEKIAGYECSRRGYEWFGANPGHEALTAYGLLEFTDMRAVFDGVDSDMVERTRTWLLARRDGQGGFERNRAALDTFGRAPAEVTDAYAIYALLYAGEDPQDLAPEIERLVTRVDTTRDAYELAVTACALAEAEHPAAAAARKKLAAMQRDDDSLCGATTSITGSGERDLTVETTAFAVLAWLADPTGAYRSHAMRACRFLQTRQTARGTFGATQATILALKALTAQAQANRRAPSSGTVRVFVGEREVFAQAFTTRDRDALECELGPHLDGAGDHEVRLAIEAEDGQPLLPWACDLAYHSAQPADDPDAALAIATSLADSPVREGGTAAIRVRVTNTTDRGQPMAIASVGLPASLEAPTQVLDALRDAQAFDVWEVRGRTLTFYWRSLEPNAVREFVIDCVARFPGESTGPASSVYLYYTPDAKRWASGVVVRVE